jgi:hypothetical protein
MAARTRIALQAHLVYPCASFATAPPSKQPGKHGLSAVFRRGVRVVEGARLESVYTVTPYRGFESLSLRHIKQKAPIGSLLFYMARGGFGENPSVRQNRRERF